MSLEKIELTAEKEFEIIEALEACGVPEEIINEIKTIFTGFSKIAEKYHEKKNTVLTLLKTFFGNKTEKTPKKDSGKPENKKNKKPSGRKKGNIPKTAYVDAETKHIEHKDLKHKDKCPNCGSGNVYKMKETKSYLNVSAVSPFNATNYELEQLKCSVCNNVFTASLPEEASKEKYDASVGAMLALLKYGFGMPSKRLESFLKSLNFPFPDSTQWDVLEKTVNKFLIIYNWLFFLAANGDVIYYDDTTAKIISRMKELEEKEKSVRTGTFTTAFVSKRDDREIAIYITGANHAGENLAALLEKRNAEFDDLILMCDALSSNIPKDSVLKIAYCLIHGRRNFIKAENNFPEEVEYVLSKFQEIYKNEAETKNKSPEERLKYHQKNSKPHMDELYQWFNEMIDSRKAEKSSGLGKAITYMLNHEKKLTAFLRIPGAPIDNNDCERIIKMPVRHRNNSYFYKNKLGAAVSDIFMSIIKTCDLNKINPFDYLVAIQKNYSEVKQNCKKWMPWNYHKTVLELQL